MKPTDESPGAQHVFDNWSLLSFVYRSLEESVAVLQGILERNHYGDLASADPWFASHVVRHHLRHRLVSPDAAPLGLDVLPLALSGIEVGFRGITLKVLKASDADSPLPPAMTKSRKSFYSLPLFASTEVYALRKLIVVWETTATGELALQLVAPNGIANGFEWVEPIPHPATMPFTPNLTVVDGEDDLDELEPVRDDADAEDLDDLGS